MITRTNFWFVFGGLWLFVGTLFASIGGVVLWQDFTLDTELARNGATASGVVLAKSMHGGANQDPAFRVEYRYTAADGTVTDRTANIDGKTWDALVEGEAVAISYVRSAPRLHRVAGEYPEHFILGSVFSALGSFFAVAGALILWHATARRKFAKRLRREGERVNAEVIEVMPTNFRINRIPQWVIRYRYHDPFGITHEGKTPPMPPEQAQLWKPGDCGQVCFERDRPQRSILIEKA